MTIARITSEFSELSGRGAIMVLIPEIFRSGLKRRDQRRQDKAA